MATLQDYILVSQAELKVGTAAPDSFVQAFSAEFRVFIPEPDSMDFDASNPDTWHEAETDVKLSVDWKADQDSPWSNSQLRLSQSACDSDSAADGANIVRNLALTRPEDDPVSTDEGNQRTVFEYQVPIFGDVPYVQCALIVSDGHGILATARIVPARPDFPDSFSMGVEANIQDRGYSTYFHEVYANECKASVITYDHVDLGKVYYVQDNTRNEAWMITAPNSTYPSGACRSAGATTDSPFVSVRGQHLASFAVFRGKANNEASLLKYAGRNEVVRGVLTDAWTQSFTVASESLTGSFEATYYYNVPSWYTDFHSGHRTLRRMHLKSPQNNMSHEYDFFDFHGAVPSVTLFQPCEIMPGGDGCDCLPWLTCPVDDAVSGNAVDLDTCRNTACARAHGATWALLTLLLLGLLGGALYSLMWWRRSNRQPSEVQMPSANAATYAASANMGSQMGGRTVYAPMDVDDQ